MKYCIDTSALIDLGERHYPERLPVFAPIWRHVYQEINNGSIVSVDVVKSELESKADDWRTHFLSQANGMFHMDRNIESEFASLVADVESSSHLFNVNKSRERFMSGADPWVIAYARSKQYTVISAETKTRGLWAWCNMQCSECKSH
ncbi:MAG: DUF4411 family protein [Nitrosomonadales bacterium]|nr:DUF4411 family protein [Nitrosomonadales bacterium]